MSDVAAVVAQIRYELRSPINTILGYSQLLLEEGESSPLNVAERHDLEGVADAGKQLLQTIGAMLDPAAITDGIEEYAFRLRYATRVQLTKIRGCIKILLERHQNAPIGDDLRRIAVAATRFFKLIDGVELTFRACASTKDDVPPSVSLTIADNEAAALLAGGGSILIIDDEEANRALLSRRLIRQGYTVLVAATGEAGLAIAARESVDVILLDVWLPGISGYEILARLKSSEASREIPVLVITAVDRPESIARCLALGADDYLPKPFDPVVLGVRLRGCLAKKRARDVDLAYLRGVARVTAAALAVESGAFVAESLDGVAQRPDTLGNLARLFQRMAMEVAARQRRLEDQVQQLTIAIDEQKKAAQVEEITDSDYFRDLQIRARHFSARRTARSSQSD